MLITGPWMDESESYSCLFDQISVPASLIQPGVLRCYCPGTEAESGGGEAWPSPPPKCRASLLHFTVLSPFLPQPMRQVWCRCRWLRIPTWCPHQYSLSTGLGTSWCCPAPSWTGSPWMVSGEILPQKLRGGDPGGWPWASLFSQASQFLSATRSPQLPRPLWSQPWWPG